MRKHKAAEGRGRAHQEEKGAVINVWIDEWRWMDGDR